MDTSTDGVSHGKPIATSEDPNTTVLPDRSNKQKPKKEKAAKPQKDPSSAKPPPKAKGKGDAAAKPPPTDPDAMFQMGFLADVYNERPSEKVVTRCTSSSRHSCSCVVWSDLTVSQFLLSPMASCISAIARL